jgi:hypothetical protein
LVVAVVEWLLFELIRIPYRPPQDMKTLLGQEKYSVVVFMEILALGWTVYVLLDGRSPLPRVRDGLAFAALLSVVAAVVAAIVIYPPWPVTPLDMVFR